LNTLDAEQQMVVCPH